MNINLRNISEIKKIVLLAILASQSIVLSIIEWMVPIPVGIPGIKLGLANVITIILLFYYNLSSVLIVVLLKCMITSLFMGNPVLFVFSISGGIFSTLVMWIMIRNMQKWFSLAGISMAGAICHNSAQMAAACLIMNDTALLTYLPVLMVTGIVSGCFTGYCSMFLLRVVKKLNLVANY